jgi:hypothetical protein
MANQAYPPEFYDRNTVLKPPLLLILVMAYCTRPLLFVVLSFNPSPKLGPAFAYMQHYATPLSVLFALPAVLVIAAWLRRLPDASMYWRVIWRYGKALLSVSLFANFIFLIIQSGPEITNAYVLSNTARISLVSLGLDLLAFYYLWRVVLVTDVFSEFPERPAKK